MTEKDLPTEYNEFVRFIEQNDTSVVAQTLNENYTENSEIAEGLKELVEYYEVQEEVAEFKGMKEAEGIWFVAKQKTEGLMKDYE